MRGGLGAPAGLEYGLAEIMALGPRLRGDDGGRKGRGAGDGGVGWDALIEHGAGSRLKTPG